MEYKNVNVGESSSGEVSIVSSSFERFKQLTGDELIKYVKTTI